MVYGDFLVMYLKSAKNGGHWPLKAGFWTSTHFEVFFIASWSDGFKNGFNTSYVVVLRERIKKKFFLAPPEFWGPGGTIKSDFIVSL